MTLLTQSWIYDSFLILFCGFIFIYLYCIRNFNYWKKCDVKQIKPIPFFGNLAPCLIGRKPFVYLLREFYKAGKNEPYIGFYVFNKPYLLIRDPELIKNVLIKDFNNFTSRNGKSSKSDIIGNMNLFALKNEHWRLFRQKLSPVFTSGKIKRMFELMLEIDQKFDIHLESLKLEGKGRTLEMKDICAKFTTDLIGITAYGMQFNTLENPNSIVRFAGKSVFGKTYMRHLEMISTMVIPSLVNFFNFKLLGTHGTKFLKDIFWEAMKEREKTNDKRGDLLDFIIELKEECEKNPKDGLPIMDNDVFIAQAAVFFTGGFETSSTTMSFALYELSKHPEIQERLRKEIVDLLNQNDGKITFNMTSTLPYLDMVISEILRLYPILPFLDRYTESDYQVPNDKLVIKTGTPVFIPMHAIHMDEKYFPKPNVFDPERFSLENKKNIKPNTYFPFGDGPRICIGMRLGLLQTKLGLIRMLSKYEFSPAAETPNYIQFDKYSILISSMNEIILNVRKIQTI